MLQLMTPAEYANFKAQLKAREDGDWKRIDWSLARRPLLHELEVVHGRMIAPNPKVWIRQSRTFTVTGCFFFTGRVKEVQVVPRLVSLHPRAVQSMHLRTSPSYTI